MKLSLSLCLLIIARLSLCQQVVYVDPNKSLDKQLRLSEIASDIKYIKLETNDSCFIGEIKKAVLDDSYIFISSPYKDYTRLLMFSVNGKFIRNIGISGRGPGEYSDVMDFCLNRAEQIIYILDPLGKILSYNYSGKYLKTINLTCRPAGLLFFNNMLWLFSAWPDYYLNNGFCILVIPTDKKIGTTYLLNRNWINAKRTPNTLVYPNYFFAKNSNNSISFFEEKFDTIYYIDSQFKVTPKFVIKLTNELPWNLLTTTEYNQAVKTHNALFDFLETKKYFFFSVMIPNPASTYFFVVSKENGEIIKHNTKDKQYILNDLDGGLTFIPKGFASENVLYSSIDCFRLKEYMEGLKSKNQLFKNASQNNRLSQLALGSDISDNPILVFLYLK